MQVKQPLWSRHAHGALVWLNADWWEPPKFSQTTTAQHSDRNSSVSEGPTRLYPLHHRPRPQTNPWVHVTSLFLVKTEFFCLILSDKAALIRPAFASPKDEQSRTRNLWSDLWKTNPDVKRTTWKKGSSKEEAVRGIERAVRTKELRCCIAWVFFCSGCSYKIQIKTIQLLQSRLLYVEMTHSVSSVPQTHGGKDVLTGLFLFCVLSMFSFFFFF